jgi:hypothetical protein
VNHIERDGPRHENLPVRCGVVASIPVLYSGGRQFLSRAGYLESFSGFFNLLSQMLGQNLNTGHGRASFYTVTCVVYKAAANGTFVCRQQIWWRYAVVTAATELQVNMV